MTDRITLNPGTQYPPISMGGEAQTGQLVRFLTKRGNRINARVSHYSAPSNIYKPDAVRLGIPWEAFDKPNEYGTVRALAAYPAITAQGFWLDNNGGSGRVYADTVILTEGQIVEIEGYGLYMVEEDHNENVKITPVKE